MTSTAGSPSSPPPPDGEAARVKSLDDRFTAIETEQQRQGGLLDKIQQALGGGGKPDAGPPAPPGAPAEPAGPSVRDQIRQGVAEIMSEQERKAAEQKQAGDLAAWQASVNERLAEHRPAEPATTARARFQRALFGKQDPR